MLVSGLTVLRSHTDSAHDDTPTVVGCDLYLRARVMALRGDRYQRQDLSPTAEPFGVRVTTSCWLAKSAWKRCRFDSSWGRSMAASLMSENFSTITVGGGPAGGRLRPGTRRWPASVRCIRPLWLQRRRGAFSRRGVCCRPVRPDAPAPPGWRRTVQHGKVLNSSKTGTAGCRRTSRSRPSDVGKCTCSRESNYQETEH